MTESTAKKYHYAVTPQERPQLVELYKSGVTLAAVGQKYGITRERVRQLLKKAGVTSFEGGRTMRSLAGTDDRVSELRKKSDRAELRSQRKWGMCFDDYKTHVAEYGSTSKVGSPMNRYIHQRKNAERRGIEWGFTFASWWAIWQESGKWSERGRGAYVMARHGDGATSYSPENVYICTQSQNSKDSFIVSPLAVRFKDRPSLAGTGRGWTLDKRCTLRPYMSQFRGKNLGQFATADEARGAYLAAFEEYTNQLKAAA